MRLDHLLSKEHRVEKLIVNFIQLLGSLWSIDLGLFKISQLVQPQVLGLWWSGKLAFIEFQLGTLLGPEGTASAKPLDLIRRDTAYLYVSLNSY